MSLDFVNTETCPPKSGLPEMKQPCRIATGGQSNEDKKVFEGADDCSTPFVGPDVIKSTLIELSCEFSPCSVNGDGSNIGERTIAV